MTAVVFALVTLYLVVKKQFVQCCRHTRAFVCFFIKTSVTIGI